MIDDTTTHHVTDEAPKRVPIWYPLCVFGGLALIGVVVLVNGIRLGLGEATDPGPGMWPATIGLVWTVAAVCAAAETVLHGRTLERLDGLGRPLVGLGLAIGFVWIFSYIGFVTALLVITVAWLRLLSTLSWRRIALATAVITALFYVLFDVVIGTAFPASLVGLG